MKERVTACLSMATKQLGKLAASDAANYTSTFTASTLLFVVGTVAQLGGRSILGYFSYALAIGEAAVGVRQLTAARFFAQKQTQPVYAAIHGDDEEFHPAPEHH